MRTYNELDRNEQKDTATLFANWLKNYTHEVIVKVIDKRDEIINNEFAMNLLRELWERSLKEQADFKSNIGYMLEDPNNFNQYDPHNHPLTHSGSYRDILYDMYIKD